MKTLEILKYLLFVIALIAIYFLSGLLFTTISLIIFIYVEFKNDKNV
jgi:hypothetical protein